ncbi:MAG: U32 family peptidase [Bacilli bacterium]|nr:U32 family peptidase [Bacilli bacterium]
MINELLAPAGNLEAVKVAIRYGADAVYCAGKRFGARSFINNLTDEEIVEAARFCHLHGKKIYITLNTLIYEDEFEDVKPYIDFLYRHVDALIVQDFGVVHYLRSHYPDFPLHISTQCSVHNLDDIRFLKSIGVNRVVLARELPLEDIRELKKEGVDLEIFIHGALCFCFSGMCYLSYYKGGRSGNRGSCAQPCRQEYSLLEDGLPLTKGALFSMKDLNTIDHIHELLSLGVTSLKIEGRAKSLEYVASVTKVYRKLIDDFNAGKKEGVPKEMLLDLYASYSREKTKGYIFKEDNRDITTNTTVKHQGVYIGKVVEYRNKQVKVKLVEELSLLDGIRFVNNGKEYGYSVTRIIENGNMVKSSRGIVYIDVEEKVLPGTKVYKTSSSKIAKELKVYEYPFFQTGSLYVELKEARQVVEIDVGEIKVRREFNEVLEKAKTVKDDAVLAQFSKNNGLPFLYKKTKIRNEEGLYIPIATINKMRSSLLEEVKERLETNVWRVYSPYPFNDDPSLFIHSNERESLVLPKKDVYGGLIDYGRLKKAPFALHLGEIGKESIVSPYFGIANSEAIKFFRNLTYDTLILSYESTFENSLKLGELDSNLGYLEEYDEPLMVAKHCPVGKYYGAENKGCGKCAKHHYEVKDNDRTYTLNFRNCYMFLEGKKVIREVPKGLIPTKIV